jgi:hypothetical protein
MTPKTTEAQVNENLDKVRNVGRALSEGGKAYVTGVLEIARTLGGFGKEVLVEAGQHVRACVTAKNLRELTELQVAFVQHRIEMTATHAKEIVDLTRVKSEAVIAPLTGAITTKAM